MSDFRLIARFGVSALLTGVIAVAGVMVGLVRGLFPSGDRDFTIG